MESIDKGMLVKQETDIDTVDSEEEPTWGKTWSTLSLEV